MSQSGYFQAFPTIEYNNTFCINISLRTKVLNNILRNNFAFYPYTVQNDERVDNIAEKYYSDGFYSWLLYLSNQIIDPYYDWHLTNDEFNNHLINKFGSLNDPQNRVVYWENNAYNDQTILSQSGFDSLPDYAKRYFIPVYQANAKSIIYQRNQDDWKQNCNQIKELFFSGNTNFQSNDLIMFNLAGSPIGSAQILRVQNTFLTYNQVQGYTDNYLLFSTQNSSNVALQVGETVALNQGNTNITDGTLISLGMNNTAMVSFNTAINITSIDNIVGLVSNGFSNVVNSLTKQSYISGYNNQTNLYAQTVNTILVNIPNDEAVYWNPVTQYNIEDNKNTYNSTIRIMDKSYATIALSQLKQDLNS